MKTTYICHCHYNCSEFVLSDPFRKR